MMQANAKTQFHQVFNFINVLVNGERQPQQFGKLPAGVLFL